MPLARKASAHPGAMLASLLSKREKLQEELRSVEKQVYFVSKKEFKVWPVKCDSCGISFKVYELETSYLQDSSHFGNALKGFEGFLSSSKSMANSKRSRKLQPEDRIFSLSSVTSPAAVELGVGRDDGRSDIGTGRNKGVAASVTVQVKPKKGRTQVGLRDSKRLRLHTEPDFEDQEDRDMMSFR